MIDDITTQCLTVLHRAEVVAAWTYLTLILLIITMNPQWAPTSTGLNTVSKSQSRVVILAKGRYAHLEYERGVSHFHRTC